MENNYLMNANTLPQRCLLLLLLTGFQQVLSNAENLQSERMQPTIVSPSYVMVGVPSSVTCTSECKSCTYSMSADVPMVQGQENSLIFSVKTWKDHLTVSCSVTNGNGQSATATKKLQVLVGPVNISISGTDLLDPNVSHTFSCHAYCQPSCSYSWKIDQGPWITGQGNVMSVTPRELDNSKTLICKATNRVSGMFSAATQDISVLVGPTDLQITGPDIIEVSEKAKFVCSAVCVPSCRYVSSVDTQTVRGNTVELTVDHPLTSVTLTCKAQNTASRKSATTTKTVLIKGAGRSASTRPDVASVLLLAGILSALSPLWCKNYGLLKSLRYEPIYRHNIHKVYGCWTLANGPTDCQCYPVL